MRHPTWADLELSEDSTRGVVQWHRARESGAKRASQRWPVDAGPSQAESAAGRSAGSLLIGLVQTSPGRFVPITIR